MATKALSSAFFPANYVTLKQLKEKRENEERRCLQLKEEEEKAAEAAAKRQNSEHEPQRPPKPRAYHQRWIPTTKAHPIGANATASAPGVSEHRPPPAGRSASNLETTPGPEGPKKNQRKKKYRKNKKKGTAAVTVEVDRDVASRSPPRKAIEAEAKAPVVDKASEEDREAMATGGAVAVVSARGRDLRSDDYSNADPIASEGPPPNGGRRSDWNRGPPMRGAVDRGGGGGRLPASGLVWVRKNPIA